MLRLRFANFIAASLALCTGAFAVPNFTGAVSNEWNNASNWSPSVVPGITDYPSITSSPQISVIDLGAGAFAYNFYANTAGTNSTLTVGTGAPGSQTLTIRYGIISNQDSFQPGNPDVIINSKVVLGATGASGENYVGTSSGRLVLLGPVTGGTGGTAGVKTLYVGGNSEDGSVEFRGVISNGGSQEVTLKTLAAHDIALFASNTYTGDTAIGELSNLRLGASNVIADVSDLVMTSLSTFLTSGFDETLGTLSLVPSMTAFGPAAIDFGNGDSSIAFANSRLLNWMQDLDLLNFNIGVDTLRFGTNATGLTSAQLARIHLPGYKASLDSAGYVQFTAIPEPSTAGLALMAIIAASLCCVRARFRHSSR